MILPTAEELAFSRLVSYCAYQWPGYRLGHHHILIARHLEAVERGDITRLMITMPPRHGKSMLASEFFPAWYLGRNPDHYIATATYAQDLADDFGRKVKNQIEDPTFQAIFPGVALADDSRSAKRFTVNNQEGGYEHGLKQQGAYYAVGVGGPLTGRGAHLLLIDDPVKNREDAESEIIRKKTKDWYTSTAYTRLMPGGRIVIIQTRWHEETWPAGYRLSMHTRVGSCSTCRPSLRTARLYGQSSTTSTPWKRSNEPCRRVTGPLYTSRSQAPRQATILGASGYTWPSTGLTAKRSRWLVGATTQ